MQTPPNKPLQTAGSSAVDLFAVAHLHDGHQFRRVVDLVQNAVVALANAVLLRAAELLAAIWSWVAREQLNLRDNALAVGLAKIADLLGRRTLDHAKVGLGLWNSPALAFGLEAALLFGGMWLYLRRRLARSLGTLILGVLMLGIQAYLFFGPPPTSDRAAASTAIVAYGVFALVIWWLQDRRASIAA